MDPCIRCVCRYHVARPSLTAESLDLPWNQVIGMLDECPAKGIALNNGLGWLVTIWLETCTSDSRSLMSLLYPSLQRCRAGFRISFFFSRPNTELVPAFYSEPKSLCQQSICGPWPGSNNCSTYRIDLQPPTGRAAEPAIRPSIHRLTCLRTITLELCVRV